MHTTVTEINAYYDYLIIHDYFIAVCRTSGPRFYSENIYSYPLAMKEFNDTIATMRSMAIPCKVLLYGRVYDDYEVIESISI